MDLFKLTVAAKGENVWTTRSPPAFRFGLPSDPEDALLNLDVGDAANARSSHTLAIGLGSLLSGAAGVFAANSIVGWLSGAIGSVPDILLNHFDPSESLGPKAMFAACFVTHATIAELGKRFFRKRGDRFASKAVAWEAVDAGIDGEGRWVVGPASLFEGEAANWTLAALTLWARNKIAILTSSEFSRFEERLAGHGCVLRKYRMVGEGRGVITTHRYGKLHSVDGQSAYKVMSFGETLIEEWYRDGQRIPMPATGHASRLDVTEAPGNAGETEDAEAPSPVF